MHQYGWSARTEPKRWSDAAYSIELHEGEGRSAHIVGDRENALLPQLRQFIGNEVSSAHLQSIASR